MTDLPKASPRARARAEMTEQIKQVARHHLASDGPNLSLRAVARDLGIVSSAVYRYFASRDELLTALILDGYASMGEAAEAAERSARRRDPVGRWTAVWTALRDWSREHPAEYALLYGSPVPGYQAPAATIAQAQRPLTVLSAIINDAVDRGVVEIPGDRLAKPVRTDMVRIGGLPGFGDMPPTVLARAMTSWTTLFGTITFELFGRYTNAVTDLEAYFDHQVRVMARYVGIGA